MLVLPHFTSTPHHTTPTNLFKNLIFSHSHHSNTHKSTNLYPFFKLKMLESLTLFMFSHIPIKNFKGMSFSIICFNPFSCSLALLVFLGFADSVLSHQDSMDSASLGFQISGFGFDSDKKDVNGDKGYSLVSENGVFQFGFLENDGGEFVVGIRYNLSPKPANLPVWTVGGGVRVSINSTFRLSMDGRLILFENPSNSVVWSSNTSNSGVKKLTLLNNGNLVLMDGRDQLIWESFNRPTNTLLPGQTLRYPQNMRAPSTRSVSSYYTFVVRADGLALMWESNVTYWSSHLSSSSALVEARFDSNGVLGLYDDMNKLVRSISSKDFGDESVSLRHLRMDQDGNLRIYSWDDGGCRWRVGWQAVDDQCNVFGSCGLYSVCGYNSSAPICECLYSGSGDGSGFPLPSPDSLDSGCKKMVDLGNCKSHTSMLVMKQTDLYGLYPPHDVDMMLSEEACKEYCSNDSSCFALTSKNDGSGLCTLKRTAFISGSTGPLIPSTSFLKACLVPQAVAAKGANPNATPKEVSFPFQGGRIINAIAFVVLVTVLAIFGFEMLVVLFVYRRRKSSSLTRALSFRKGAKDARDSVLLRLSFAEVHELTVGFSTQLGSSVFKGLLPGETAVAAKVLDASKVVSEKEFLMAVSLLGATHHRNLVALHGFCFEPKHAVLVYEYAPNGSVDKWLFNTGPREKNWQQRAEIAVGVTRALAYLHTECRLCIPHGDLKLEKVVLDDKMIPKLTDFGIKSFLQTESSSSPSLSTESPSENDIYMLGKLLLEIVVCCRDPVGDGLDQVMEKVSREQEYVDAEDFRGVERVVRIALWCMQNQPFLRPSVGEVMKVLEGTLSVDRPPASFDYRDGGGAEEKEVADSAAEIV